MKSAPKNLIVILDNLFAFLLKYRLNIIAIAVASLLASLKLRQLVHVRWDGVDWLYTWKNNGAVDSKPTYNPKRNAADLDLFFFAYTPKEGDVIVDIGVANGEEIPSFCAQVGKTGKVIAIEADPSCYRRLNKLKKLLGLENLTIIGAGVGAIAGNLPFTQDRGVLSNRIVSDGKHQGSTISIRIDTLQELLHPVGINYIDYMKANIEGAEIDLLRGLAESALILRNVCISCHDFIGPEIRSYDFVKSWLANSGYHVSGYEPQQLQWPWRNYYLYGSL
jgi:FkbM family methyltransferase